jgi:hypothetical protein
VVRIFVGLWVRIQAGMLAKASAANETVTPIDNSPAFPGALQFRQKMAG